MFIIIIVFFFTSLTWVVPSVDLNVAFIYPLDDCRRLAFVPELGHYPFLRKRLGSEFRIPLTSSRSAPCGVSSTFQAALQRLHEVCTIKRASLHRAGSQSKTSGFAGSFWGLRGDPVWPWRCPAKLSVIINFQFAHRSPASACAGYTAYAYVGTGRRAATIQNSDSSFLVPFPTVFQNGRTTKRPWSRLSKLCAKRTDRSRELWCLTASAQKQS